MLTALRARATAWTLARHASVPGVRLALPAVQTMRRVGAKASASAAAEVATPPAPATTQLQPEALPTPAPAPTAAAQDDVKGPMLEPSVANKGWVRSLAMAGAVLAAAGSTAVLPARATGFLTLTAYGLWLGTLIYSTFIVGLTMFKAMPRQMFGRVQAQLFPKYFWLTSVCNVLLLGAAALGTTPASAAALGSAAVVTLSVALAASLANAVYLEPRATKLMFARYEIENKAEKTEEDKSEIARLYKAFGKMHGMSSLLNLVVTCAALAFGWQLSGVLTL